jgi:hypothetical protein
MRGAPMSILLDWLFQLLKAFSLRPLFPGASTSWTTRKGKLLRVEPLEDRCLLATIAWDGGVGSFNWQDDLNWDTDTLPGAADDAFIGDLAGTVQVNGTTAVNSLTSHESLSFNSGTFTVASSVDVTNVGGTWNATGGTLRITADSTLDGFQMFWGHTRRHSTLTEKQNVPLLPPGFQSNATDDESRNNVWLAVPTLGESWHNNHQAHPTYLRDATPKYERLINVLL